MIPDQKLFIGHHSFDVKSAFLSGNLEKGKLSWMMEVAGSSKLIEEELWTPRISSELLPLINKKASGWPEIFSESVSWKAEYSELHDENNGHLYVVQHLPIPQAKIEFFSNEYERICFLIEGKAGVYDCTSVEPFSARGTLEFKGVYTRIADPELARSELSRFIDTDEFSFEECSSGLFRFSTLKGK